MEKMNHAFFGELDIINGKTDELDCGDVLWEEEINGINVILFYDEKPSYIIDHLDVFAKFLSEFKRNDEIARVALEKYLLEDRTYIDFHREETTLDLPEDAKQFAQIMKVTTIGFWLAEESSIIVDYMIDPEVSDQLLAVKFDCNCEVEDISWES